MIKESDGAHTGQFKKKIQWKKWKTISLKFQQSKDSKHKQSGLNSYIFKALECHSQSKFKVRESVEIFKTVVYSCFSFILTKPDQSCI